jgi:uncharacterized membrane protein YdjX (TVP38/TMEM64 family)
MARTSSNNAVGGIVLAMAAGAIWWLFFGSTWQFTPIVAAVVVAVIVGRTLAKEPAAKPAKKR